MILLVAYDLHNPGRDYDAVAEVLRAADSYKHPQGSVWLLDTQIGPSTWRDRLKGAGDANDEYFIVRLAHNWAASRLDTDAASWLKDPERTW